MDIKEFEIKCKNCSHTKGDHYSAVPDPTNNPKAEAGICRKEGCECKTFAPETKWQNLPKSPPTEWKNEPKNTSAEWKLQEKHQSGEWKNVPKSE